MDAGKREEAIADYISFITLCEDTLVLPYRDYHLAIQALRLLVATRGTTCLIKS